MIGCRYFVEYKAVIKIKGKNLLNISQYFLYTFHG